MYTDILVATDRSDVAERSLRQRVPRKRRFINRLKGVTREVLVPTDPAGQYQDVVDAIEVRTDNATHHAVDLAEFYGARLHVLYVIDSLRYDTSLESAVEPLEEEGEAVLEGIVRTAEGVGVPVTSTIEVGRPTRLILAYADDHDVDLIVLNARSRGGLQSHIWGSYVSSVIRRADVPVYSVPLAEADESP